MLKCPEKTEVWSRVVGFFRPVSQFNRGKKAEYRERVNFAAPPMFPKSVSGRDEEA